MRNILLLNDIILFNFCATSEITLPDGHLGASRDAYSQSYPQILWVRHFLMFSNELRAYAKVKSSIVRQAAELI